MSRALIRSGVISARSMLPSAVISGRRSASRAGFGFGPVCPAGGLDAMAVVSGMAVRFSVSVVCPAGMPHRVENGVRGVNRLRVGPVRGSSVQQRSCGFRLRRGTREGKAFLVGGRGAVVFQRGQGPRGGRVGGQSPRRRRVGAPAASASAAASVNSRASAIRRVSPVSFWSPARRRRTLTARGPRRRTRPPNTSSIQPTGAPEARAVDIDGQCFVAVAGRVERAQQVVFEKLFAGVRPVAAVPAAWQRGEVREFQRVHRCLLYVLFRQDAILLSTRSVWTCSSVVPRSICAQARVRCPGIVGSRSQGSFEPPTGASGARWIRPRLRLGTLLFALRVQRWLFPGFRSVRCAGAGADSVSGPLAWAWCAMYRICGRKRSGMERQIPAPDCRDDLGPDALTLSPTAHRFIHARPLSRYTTARWSARRFRRHHRSPSACRSRRCSPWGSAALADEGDPRYADRGPGACSPCPLRARPLPGKRSAVARLARLAPLAPAFSVYLAAWTESPPSPSSPCFSRSSVRPPPSTSQTPETQAAVHGVFLPLGGGLSAEVQGNLAESAPEAEPVLAGVIRSRRVAIDFALLGEHVQFFLDRPVPNPSNPKRRSSSISSTMLRSKYRSTRSPPPPSGTATSCPDRRAISRAT